MSRTLNTPIGQALRPMIAIFYAIAAAIHVLIIAKLIPYQWVNGGMSKLYSAQLAQSITSLIIISLLFLFVWKTLHHQGALRAWQRRMLYVVTAFWAIGLIMQLLGTTFERAFMSPVLIFGILSHILLIKSTRKTH
jgi:fumarate reductase subunit D